MFNTLDWEGMLLPATPIIEIIIRGTIVYLSLFIVLRVVLKREAATLGMTDLLTLVLLANAVENSMAGDKKSIFDGVLLVIVIVCWSHFLNFLGHRFPYFEKLIKPPKLPLVKEGRMLKRNMRKEFITDEELMAEVRMSGINKIEEVEEAYMESTGKISVIAKTGTASKPHEKKVI
jgi:uncharacterized membrane protein YcaP (DUF421 family)